MVLRFYLTPGLDDAHTKLLTAEIRRNVPKLPEISLQSEFCFHVGLREGIIDLKDAKVDSLKWLLGKSFAEECRTIGSMPGTIGSMPGIIGSMPGIIGSTPDLKALDSTNEFLVEIGPRLSFTTPYSTNAVSACKAAGIDEINRLERSIRYLITINDRDGRFIDSDQRRRLIDSLHDRMTECVYETPPDTFELMGGNEKSLREIDVLEDGLKALKAANAELGLALDSQDLDYYVDLFQKKICRNPTEVELFDLAQSNSEHSRHWFFKGKLFSNGKEQERTLLQMVMDTQKFTNQNNVIKFSDNSSGIQGYKVNALISTSDATAVGKLEVGEKTRDIIYTAETHNFPTGVCPFPGAATGTGGRIRDVQAAGRGGHVIAGLAGYSFGNLLLPDYTLPWEDESVKYPRNFALPREVIIQASNGASDYGNKFGEPVIAGFARSFGQLIDGDRLEWIKPIMFSGGIGSIEHEHLIKDKPQIGMLVAKMGGPVYRIGVGGGSASSVHVQGDASGREDELDFGAVQRGDPEMGQKLNRATRALIEMGHRNPIRAIHDQGAGGNGNVLKELVEGAGAVIRASDFDLGDPTISLKELWVAEFQESNALLVKQEDKQVVEMVCARERCPLNFVGEITGDNRIVLEDFRKDQDGVTINGCAKHAVDLDLDWVLGSIPQKEFYLTKTERSLHPLNLPQSLTVKEALELVLRLPSVASKRYLTNKVDRSVTGLVAQQQCVGPLHCPVADVAVVALSHFDTIVSCPPP